MRPTQTLALTELRGARYCKCACGFVPSADNKNNQHNSSTALHGKTNACIADSTDLREGTAEIVVPNREMLFIRDNLVEAESARRRGDTATVYKAYNRWGLSLRACFRTAILKNSSAVKHHLSPGGLLCTGFIFLGRRTGRLGTAQARSQGIPQTITVGSKSRCTTRYYTVCFPAETP